MNREGKGSIWNDFFISDLDDCADSGPVRLEISQNELILMRKNFSLALTY